MTWDFYDTGEEFILKEKKQVPKELLDSLDAKGRKKLKKILQSSEPTEFFGQDFTKLGELIDVVATATKLRKEYELLYRQLRDLVYPSNKKEVKE